MHVAIALLLIAASPVTSLSELERAEALAWVAAMKVNKRGPFVGVAWFCKDGTVLPPKSFACVDHGGGFQYGVLSQEAQKLGKAGIYVGTVLAALPPDALLVDDYYRSRALIVESYLERALNGWVLEAARNYRGFRQVEDEQESARWLLIELAKRADILSHNRSLAIRTMRALPYGRQGSLADEVRALAGLLGDADRDFANLRYKIHAMPEPADVPAVEAYGVTKTGELAEMCEELVTKMTALYDPASRFERLRSVRSWIWHSGCKSAIQTFIDTDSTDALALLRNGAALMTVAEGLLQPGPTTKQGERNLLLLHVISVVEELWVGLTAPLAKLAMTREQGLEVAEILLRSAGRVGLLSPREVTVATDGIAGARTGAPAAYAEGIAQASRALEWARARLLADLGVALGHYQAVEPRARTVIDDILRSGVMLPLAAVLDRLNTDVDRLRGGGHRIVGLGNAGGTGLRGENAGFATGPLAVLEPGANARQLKRNQIVLLPELPPELPPVAGIITLGAAGSLSHVALLARNLGIPHAAVGGDMMDALLPLVGKELLLGVSAGGRVAVGPRASFPDLAGAGAAPTAAYRAPFLEINEKILDLKTTRIHALSEISPKDSGARVGPKAAELGRLRALFPDRVSDAAVIPFGAFLRHVSRPGEDGISPIDRARAAYQRARAMTPQEAEKALLPELAVFRESIATLPYPEGFEAEVDAALARLGEVGSFGVFIRSDTNVEDLKEFTGAGLNKTVANRTQRDSILAAIRKVWASPYTERSFRWRQRILKNPEYVFPSVILHRTVPSEISGVMVTTDLEGKTKNAISISASEGVAAVVDGGSPETIVIEPDGTVRLLASSRSSTRKLIPPAPAEGVIVTTSEGRDPLLGEAEIKEMTALAAEIKKQIPAADGLPWDIEFGIFEDKAYLLQIRPLRTSRSAATYPFLVALDEKAALPTTKLDLAEALP